MSTPLLWTKRLAFGAYAAGTNAKLAGEHARADGEGAAQRLLQECDTAAGVVAGARRARFDRHFAIRMARDALPVRTGDRLEVARAPALDVVHDPVRARHGLSLLQRRHVRERLLRWACHSGPRARQAGPQGTERHIKKKAIYWDWEYIHHSLKAIARQLVFGLVALLASPLLGVVVPLFRFGYRIRSMQTVFWIPVFVAFCIPATRVSALQLVHLWIDARAVIRELYDPIIARLKTAHSDAAYLKKKESEDDGDDTEVKKKLQTEWHRGRSDSARLGFALVFGYLLQIPFIGPLTWFVGFVAAGLFAPELIELHVFTVQKRKRFSLSVLKDKITSGMS